MRPSRAISSAHSGANSTPPTLAPLKAIESAAGRFLSNHGATIALIAAPLVSAQPAPLGNAARNSSHGDGDRAHATTPAQASTPPMRVASASPKRRWIAGSRATMHAESRKWQVIAAETVETGQPLPACSACRNTDGP